MRELPETLQYAPMPLLIIDENDLITALNDAASAMGFERDTNPLDYVKGISEPFCEYLRYQPPGTIYRFQFRGAEKCCKVAPIKFAELTCLWLQDLSENLALADRLSQQKRPGSLQLRQINQLTITAMGYSELLDVVMSDQKTLSASKLSTVKQYQQEVTRNLRAIQELIAGTNQPTQGGSILVVEPHEALAELISELLRGAGYRVTTFSDAGSALKYVTLNAQGFGKAIVDKDMTTEGEGSFLDALKMAAPDLPVLLLTDESEGEGTIRKPLDFNLLLQAVQET